MTIKGVLEGLFSIGGKILAIFLLLFVSLPKSVQAIPTDHFHLGSGGGEKRAWSAAPFYRYGLGDGGIGLRADLGFQLARHMGTEHKSTIFAHWQPASFLLGYSVIRGSLLSLPLRWTAGLDVSGPFSYLVEAQTYWPMGRFEPHFTLRAQSTGFSVESGDGAHFTSGSATRFLLVSTAIGLSYTIHRDLKLASSVTVRGALGASDFRDFVVCHTSIQWLWGG